MANNKRANSQVTKSPSEVAPTPVKIRVTRQSMGRCNVCTEQITLDYAGEENLTVMCRKCSTRYHCKCVGISSQFFFNLIQNSKKGWLCYGCSQDAFKFVQKLEERITNLEHQVQLNTHNIQQLTTSVDSGLEAIDEKYGGITERLNEEIQILKNKMSGESLSMNQDEIVKSITEETLRKLHQSKSTSQNDDMRYVHALQRKNNLIFHNVPNEPLETKESLTKKVLKVCNALGVEVQPQNVSVAIRLNKKPSTRDNIRPAHSQPDIPVVLIKFCDAAIKDEIFNAYLDKIMNKAPLTQQAIGCQSSKRIYINHHLSPELARLKQKAIGLKKEGKVMKVNARYNYIRIYINNQWHKVDSTEGLDALFDMDY